MEIKQIDNETIGVFIPTQIARKRGRTMLIIPDGTKLITDGGVKRHYDMRLIKAFAKAHRWQLLLKEGKVANLAEISQKEKVTTSYATRLYRLNYIAPKIVDVVISGLQPRTLRLLDFMANAIPELWLEQYEVYGIDGGKVC